jgi:hypothetical protein
MDFKEINYEVMDWIGLAYTGDQFIDFVELVKKLSVL